MQHKAQVAFAGRRGIDLLLPVRAGLYGRALPQTVANFLTLVKSGAYSGTAFTKACALTPHPSSALRPCGMCWML